MYKLMRLLTRWTGFVAFQIWLSGAVAAPLTYSELVSGDLDNQNIGAVDVGVNIIQGQICFSDAASCLDFDSFKFTLSPGLSLDSALFSWVTALEPGTTLASVQYVFQGVNELIDTTIPGTRSAFASALPLTEAGEYQVFHFVVTKTGPGWITDYTWALNVSAVSAVAEPATLALLGLGLAGLGFSRRKRAAK